ncbi:uncharacterized protein METZ01_LOCUS147510 [marine metagenome]|uniref:Uncharacterized protein n=1 Tax=marine metagenome TaxID=408172 RepID=A0A381ZZG0_9ZZZZ|tara:strand:+ start:50 stop:475 length:426 start_codon:yes stop_codon:yes gene_type:complete
MKIKSLFDHINHITSKQTKGYWDSLNEREKKQWSNYMINRFLSMKMEWTDFVNEIQKLKLDSYQLYVVYSSILPKGKQYLKYIKKKKGTIYSKQVIQTISEYFQISKSESEDYLNLLSKKQIRELVSKYGYANKELKQMGL